MPAESHTPGADERKTELEGRLLTLRRLIRGLFNDLRLPLQATSRVEIEQQLAKFKDYEADLQAALESTNVYIRSIQLIYDHGYPNLPVMPLSRTTIDDLRDQDAVIDEAYGVLVPEEPVGITLTKVGVFPQ